MMTPKRPEDLDILNNPDSWPLWPVMPMKHRTKKGDFGIPEIGFVISGRPWVYLSNYSSLKTGPLAPQLAGIGAAVYDSFEALLADGWMVD